MKKIILILSVMFIALSVNAQFKLRTGAVTKFNMNAEKGFSSHQQELVVTFNGQEKMKVVLESNESLVLIELDVHRWTSLGDGCYTLSAKTKNSEICVGGNDSQILMMTSEDKEISAMTIYLEEGNFELSCSVFYNRDLSDSKPVKVSY